MQTETITYFDGDLPLKGFMAFNDKTDHRRPAVLVAPAFRGLDEFARKKALQLAQFGYVAFALDMYGEGKVTEDLEEAGKLMAPFYFDRALLQQRALAAFDYMSGHELVDRTRMGAIGFCFGGLVAIELIRSGAPLKGAVSFHGVLGNSLQGTSAKTVPISPSASGSLLILHGHDDPLVPPADVLAMQEELSGAGIDWQMHIYGGTMHAFTNPKAQAPEKGTLYSEKADRRSLRAMQNHFDELFSP